MYMYIHMCKVNVHFIHLDNNKFVVIIVISYMKNMTQELFSNVDNTCGYLLQKLLYAM